MTLTLIDQSDPLNYKYQCDQCGAVVDIATHGQPDLHRCPPAALASAKPAAPPKKPPARRSAKS